MSALLVVFLVASCGDGEDLGRAPAQHGDAAAYRAETEACLGCHASEAADWQNPSSHRALFACSDCHSSLAKAPGPGHAKRPACTDCHSEMPHPTSNSACTGCHDQHGSANAFLIRTAITRPDGTSAEVHFTAAEGASADGLVHTGAQAGTGVCETCHTQTSHYLENGQGTPHYAAHCSECHLHENGFAHP